MIITDSLEIDLEQILNLQKLSYIQEAQIYNDNNIPPLNQTLSEITIDFKSKLFIKAVEANTIVGSVRAFEQNHTCYIERLIVHPDYQNKGIGTSLLNEIENRFSNANRFELFTGSKSEKNLYLYRKLGYKDFKEEKLSESVNLKYLEKMN